MQQLDEIGHTNIGIHQPAADRRREVGDGREADGGRPFTADRVAPVAQRRRDRVDDDAMLVRVLGRGEERGRVVAGTGHRARRDVAPVAPHEELRAGADETVGRVDDAAGLRRAQRVEDVDHVEGCIGLDVDFAREDDLLDLARVDRGEAVLEPRAPFVDVDARPHRELGRARVRHVQRVGRVGALDRGPPRPAVGVAGDDPRRQDQIAVAFERERAERARTGPDRCARVANVADGSERGGGPAHREPIDDSGGDEAGALAVEPREAARPEVVEQIARIVDRLGARRVAGRAVGRGRGHARVPVSNCAAPKPRVRRST